MNIKDRLLAVLGTAGLILWYVLSVSIIAVPLSATRFPFGVQVILLALILFTNFVGAIISVFIFGYGAYVVFHEPFSTFTVVFIIFFVIYIIFFFIPAVLNLIASVTRK